MNREVTMKAKLEIVPPPSDPFKKAIEGCMKLEQELAKVKKMSELGTSGSLAPNARGDLSRAIGFTPESIKHWKDVADHSKTVAAQTRETVGNIKQMAQGFAFLGASGSSSMQGMIQTLMRFKGLGDLYGGLSGMAGSGIAAGVAGGAGAVLGVGMYANSINNASLAAGNGSVFVQHRDPGNMAMRREWNRSTSTSAVPYLLSGGMIGAGNLGANMREDGTLDTLDEQQRRIQRARSERLRRYAMQQPGIASRLEAESGQHELYAGGTSQFYGLDQNKLFSGRRGEYQNRFEVGMRGLEMNPAAMARLYGPEGASARLQAERMHASETGYGIGGAMAGAITNENVAAKNVAMQRERLKDLGFQRQTAMNRPGFAGGVNPAVDEVDKQIKQAASELLNLEKERLAAVKARQVIEMQSLEGQRSFLVQRKQEMQQMEAQERLKQRTGIQSIGGMDPMQQMLLRSKIERFKGGQYVGADELGEISPFMPKEVEAEMLRRGQASGIPELLKGTSFTSGQAAAQESSAATQKQLDEINLMIEQAVEKNANALLEAFRTSVGPLGELGAKMIGVLRAEAEILRQQQLEQSGYQQSANSK